MSFFTLEQINALAGTTVRVGTLVAFKFSPATRYWNGNGTLTAGGYEWIGLGSLGSIEGLFEGRTTDSKQVKFTLSGTTAEMNTLALLTAKQQAGFIVDVSLQLFNEDWQTVGSPILVWLGLTDPVSASNQSAQNGASRTRSITISAENLFYGRSRIPAGNCTDTDQKQRYPGDKFMEYRYLLRNLQYVWP